MNLKHLISEFGILVNFNVAKKISPEKIKSLENKLKKKIKKGDNLEDLLKHEISKQTQKTLDISDIPGLIGLDKSNIEKNNSKGIFQDEAKVLMLNYFAMTLTKKMITQKFKKDEICFIILTILGTLGLTDQDFRMFHKNNQQSDENLNDNDEFDDDDDDYNEEY